MTNPVVNVNVNVLAAPSPSTLQSTGAFISQGATNTSPGTKSPLTKLADLTPLLSGAFPITGITQLAGLATVVTTSPHNLPIGDPIELTIAGSTISAYNGTFLCTPTTSTHFTYVVPSATTSPATGTISYTLEDVAELLAMATTFFAQGGQQAVYVLELGADDVTAGVAFLAAWITANPGTFYSYLVPRTWDANAAYLAMVANFEATTAKTYFFTTTTLATWQSYTNLMKSVFPLVECPSYGVWPANALASISYAAAWGSNVLTAISWSAANGGTVTATTTTAHGVVPGNQFTISGCTPAGYDGTFIALPGTTASTLIYALAVNPGAETLLGTLAASAGGTVTAATTTNHGVLPGQYFSISGCLPAAYNGTFLAIAGTATTSLVWNVPAAIGAETLLGTLVQSQYASGGVPSTEFSLAAAFFDTLSYRPSSTNKVTPLNLSYQFGVTPFPTQGNAAILSTLNAGNVSVIGTGAQGGISTAILIGGNMLDGNPFNYWYSVDWVQINVPRNISAFLIAGANNPQNPVYYNQDGIKGVQQVAVSTMNSGITYGLVLNTVKQTTLGAIDFITALDADQFSGYTIVNAEPFATYATANPNDYKGGIYNGISIDYTPLIGFESITINISVSQFAL